jgi:hypothetical protein
MTKKDMFVILAILHIAIVIIIYLITLNKQKKE